MSSASMVSGRIPIELRRRGDAELAKIGSTPSKLIRAAYEYVVATGNLPTVQSSASEKRRTLSASEKKALVESIEASTFSVPSSYFEGKTDEELLQQALLEKYGEGLEVAS